MVYSLKGYKCLSVTQLVNIFVVVIYNLKAFDGFRLLCAYLYLEAKREATERTLKLKGHAIQKWHGPSIPELRKILGGRRSIKAILQPLVDAKLISITGNRIKICETPLSESRHFLGLICGLDEFGSIRRSITRPVPIPHEWLFDWAKPTRSKLVPLLHLFYCATCLSFKRKSTSEVNNAATFKFENFIYYTGLHRSRLRLARKKLIEEKRITPDTTKYQRKLNRDGHYAAILMDWNRGSVESNDTESGPPQSKNCTSVGHPYRDNKQALLVGRNQKRSGVFTKQNRKAPTLKNVKLTDLWDVGRLKVLFEQQPWLKKTLPNFQFFVTAAIKARSVGKNPGKLFVWLVRSEKRSFVSQSHEDIALKAISEYQAEHEARMREAKHEISFPCHDKTLDCKDALAVDEVRRLARRELVKLGAKYAA